MIEWIVRPAFVAAIAVGQILAPQSLPARSAGQTSEQIRIDAAMGPGSVFSSGDLVTALGDNAITNSYLAVSAATGGAVIDISVRLRINHPRVSDLDIQLVGPDGTTVKLAGDVGQLSADFGSGSANCSGTLTTFDDDAPTAVFGATAPFGGVYRPDGRLSNFRGRGASGVWILRVTDTDLNQAGILYCWQLVMRRGVITGDFAFGRGRSDLAYWRPSTGAVVATSIGSADNVDYSPLAGVTASDILAPADTNGDGWPTPLWFNPSTGQWRGFYLVPSVITWGGSGDVPVPGDYDADGFDDLAVWRPSTGTWYVRNQFSWAWGGAGDIPVPGDYNGDGTTDMAVWRPSTGAWYVYGGTSLTWGGGGDIPVPADYDGDGRTDFGIWRPVTGEWFIYTAAGVAMPVHVWGGNGDIPVPADYDSDLKAELAVWRPSDGTYYIRGVGNRPWGQAGDVPAQKRPAYPGYPY
jgi:subtilisin-like proprotein convertase family protein